MRDPRGDAKKAAGVEIRGSEETSVEGVAMWECCVYSPACGCDVPGREGC